MNQPSPPFFARIRQLLAAGEMPEALHLLRSLLDNSPRLKDAIQQSARYEDICQQVRLGTVGHEDATLTKNQIRWGLLELLDALERQGDAQSLSPLLHEMETQAAKASLREEVERAISIVNSKNVNAGTASAGRDLHIGDTHHHYGEQRPSHTTSKWLKIGATIVVTIGLLASLAEFSGYPLRDLFDKKEDMPAVNPSLTEPSKSDTLPTPNTPNEVAREKPKMEADKVKNAPRNHFESNDSSKQINAPDNQGIININQ